MTEPTTPAKPTESECPSCGAPLHLDDLPATQTQVKCDYCGTVVNIPGRSKLAQPAVQQTVITINAGEFAQDFAPAVGKVAKGSALVGLVTTLVMLAFVGGILVFVFSRVTNTSVSAVVKDLPKVVNEIPKAVNAIASVGVNPFYQAALAPRGDGIAPDVVSIYREPGGVEQYRVVSMNPADKSIRWREGSVSKEWYYARFIGGQGLIYLNDGDKLGAFNADTGAAAWQVSLASAPPTSCETCVRLIGESVVSFGRDGTLQGFDATNGKGLWSKRLDPFQGRPLDAAGRIAHMQAVSATRPGLGYALNVLDPATGDVKARIEAVCQIGANTRSSPRSAEAYRFSPSGDAVYAVITDGSGDISGCLQKYDLATGKQAWSTTFRRADNFPSAIASWVSFLATPNALYVSNESGDAPTVNVIDGATGKARRFSLDKQYSYKLLDAAPKESEDKGTLVVQAKPKFDSQRTEVWGLDATTGARRWQFVLTRQFTFPAYDMRLTKSGFAVLQCGSEGGGISAYTCLFDRLDPHTGVSAGQVKHTLQGTSGTVKTLWDETRAWVLGTNRLLAINLADGKAQYELP